MDTDIQVKKAVILASGYGRRMRKTVPFPSKPMTLVDKKPLISYIIDLLIAGGIEKIYIVHHSVTADVSGLLDYNDDYAKYLEFVEEDVQKGTLLTFSRVKERLAPPFLMAFEDVIAYKSDFIDMLNFGKQYISSEADLVIQTVRKPSVLSEKAFLTENGRIVGYQKNGYIDAATCAQEKKYGGMVFLWLSDPFPLINDYLLRQNYKFSAFLENYIAEHSAFEMPIEDMWDIDTPETILATEKLMEKRGR